jgi:hypothetical protein
MNGDDQMSVLNGLIIALSIVSLGAVGLTLFALYIRAKYEHPQREQDFASLVLSLSPAEDARLEQLAESGNTSKSEVVRKALALFAAVVDTKSA